MDVNVFLFVLAALIDVTNINAQLERGHSPFYWQPKLILNLITPKKAVDSEQVVLLRGYKLGITMMAVIEGIPERHKHHHLNPMEVEFYTDAYRWLLRHLQLVPLWIYGEAGNYVETIKLWKTRFMYADSFVPNWIQRLLFFIPAEKWVDERNEFIAFTKYAGATYAKHLRYTMKNRTGHARWWHSHESKDSIDELPPLDDNITGIRGTRRNIRKNKRKHLTSAERESGLGAEEELDQPFDTNPFLLNRTGLDNTHVNMTMAAAFMKMSESDKQAMFEKFIRDDVKLWSEKRVDRPARNFQSDPAEESLNTEERKSPPAAQEQEPLWWRGSPQLPRPLARTAAGDSSANCICAPEIICKLIVLFSFLYQIVFFQC